MANIWWTLACVLVSCSFLSEAQYFKVCSHPKNIKSRVNGTKAEYRPGEVLSFSCDVGHQLVGSITTKCLASGHWDKRYPRCKVIKCEEVNIKNGGANFKRTKFNTTLTITCDMGFHLRGSNLIRCAVNGSWTPAVPSCESDIRCPPPAVDNGRTQDGGGRDYSIGESVTIVCQKSFDLIGSPQITCGPNGQWQALPECRFSSGKCGQLPKHPLAHPRENYLREGGYEANVQVRFRCNHGYRWTGGNPSIYCMNGQWTRLDIKCEKKNCGSAGEILNGRFQYTGISFGDTATAICNEGHHLIGSGVRHCRDDGWDGRIPVCEVVKCPQPPEVPNAKIAEPTFEDVEYRHVVSYQCLSGTLIGESDIYCTATGEWSAPPPQCRDVSCSAPQVEFGYRIYGFKSHYKPRDIVMFSCNTGYEMQGSATVSCDPQGDSWTPALPKCFLKN
ncbi:complement receptor type 1 isoform X2 [Hoplias malabaricus]|uniref:complement receptor type 1 isoform X2 n=1 Tax=Hoplias malabaricus TaxID=27720 RepID=UPI003461ADC9